jgi:hypothetical protein
MRAVGRGEFASVWFMGLMAFVVAPFAIVSVHAQDYLRWPRRMSEALRQVG